MNVENFKNSKGQIIDTYDDLFTFEEKFLFLMTFRESLYKISGADIAVLGKDFNQINSRYTHSELLNTNFCNTQGFRCLENIYGLSKRNIKQIRVNCVTPLEFDVAHTDRPGLTLVYFANHEWDIFWGGHTIFLNESLTEIEKLVIYKFGRVVIFDGTIPHSISPVSLRTNHFRLSFVIQFD